MRLYPSNLYFLVSTLVATVVAVEPAINPLIPVHLRIEGEHRTIYEEIIHTRGHNITTASGGTHRCNGLNNNANKNAGATCTSALADAAKKEGFTFDGSFHPEFDDFEILTIKGRSQTSIKFWGILNNFKFIPVGGCQQEVTSSDEVLFAFDAFSKAHFLKLLGPTLTQVRQPTTFKVIDGMTGGPVAGAIVGGQISKADGSVCITFSKAGEVILKASKDDSIRSNAIHVVVL